jgi:hypothetical protein
MKHFYFKKNLKVFLLHLILFFIGFALHTQAQCDWQSLGNDESDQPSYGPVKYTSIAAYGNNQLFVAYADQDLGGKVSVSKFDGTRWNILGTRGFSGGNAEYVKIKVDKLGTPYVVFKDGANGNKASVMKYNGTSWVYVGGSGISSGGANYTSLAIDTSGNLFVSYSDTSLGYKAVVKKFDGITWSNVGTNGFSADSSNFNAICLSNNGTPHIAYSDASIGHQVMVKKFNGLTWVNVGTGAIGPINAPTDNLSMAINKFNDIYLVSMQGYFKFNGSTWTTFSQSSFNIPRRFSSIAFDNLGQPIVLFDAALQTEIIYTFGSTLYNLPISYSTGIPSNGIAKYQDVTVDANGNPIMIYTHSNNESKAICITGNPGLINGINPIGTGVNGLDFNGTSNTYSNYTSSLSVANNGTPYVAYISGSGRYFDLSYFNGTQWKYLGGPFPGAPGPSGTSVDLTMHGNNPALMMHGVGFGPTIYEYNGNSWNRLGLDPIYGDLFPISTYPNFSNDGNYIGYRDPNNNNKATIRQLNSSMQIVGNAGFTPGAATPIIEYPFVIFRDVTNSNQIGIMKLVNNVWTNFTTTGLTTNAVFSVSLRKDNTGNPYIGYFDPTINQYKVMKYNGTSWIDLNLSSYNMDPNKRISMVLGANNIPYIIFSNLNNGGKFEIINYQNNTWSLVGTSQIANSKYYSIAVDSNKVPIIMYENMRSVYARKLGATTLTNTSISNLNPCAGSTLQFSSSGGTNYLWTGPNGFTSTTSSPSISNMTAAKSGIYKVIFTDTGCVSLIQTKSFNVKVGFYGTRSISLCRGKKYTIGNHTYAISGIYKDTLTNPVGCDSIITTNLNISTQFLTTTKNINLCGGQSYTYHNKTYSSTGIYKDTIFQGPLGCDSLITININVANPININTSVVNNTITSLQNGATYKWLNCNTNSAIPNIITQSYTPAINGSYAVIVKVGNCKDTSACVIINSIGLNQVSNNNTFYISPNPNNGTFKINTNAEAQLAIYDALGRTIFQQTIKAGESSITLNNEKSGVYYAKVITAHQQWVKRIVINK